MYLIFLDQTDSSSEETSDDNIDLSIYHECIGVIERNNSLRTVYRRVRRTQSICWFINICNNWENVEFKRHFRITKTTFEWFDVTQSNAGSTINGFYDITITHGEMVRLTHY